MEELKNFNARKLYKKLDLPDNEFEGWMKELGLLHSVRTCECGGSMSLRTRKGKNYSWRCTGLLTVALRGSR
jgi:hypothetical protein